MKRAFDIAVSLTVLVVLSPLIAAIALLVRIASPGPSFYLAKRVGLNGELFTMYKFRTMHAAGSGPVITANADPRVFKLGKMLRKLKLDELPQFFNVLRGDMSIVGPRPEDPLIVKDHYTPWMMETLKVRPGITSPGAIFQYSMGEALIDDANPESSYVEKLLPPKLAIELAYLARANFFSDIQCMLLTSLAIAGVAMGWRVPPPAQDMLKARDWVVASAFPDQPA